MGALARNDPRMERTKGLCDLRCADRQRSRSAARAAAWVAVTICPATLRECRRNHRSGRGSLSHRGSGEATPSGLIADSQYRSRPDGAGDYFLQPNERYLRQKPDLVRVRNIAGPSMKVSHFDELASLKERIEPPMTSRIRAAVEARGRRQGVSTSR